MSLGPTNGSPTEVVKTPIEKIQILGYGIAKDLSAHSSKFIFNFGVCYLLISLMMGYRPPIEYYAIVALMGVIWFCTFAYQDYKESLCQENKQ